MVELDCPASLPSRKHVNEADAIRRQGRREARPGRCERHGARPVGRDSRHHRRDAEAGEPAPPRRARPDEAARRRQPGPDRAAVERHGQVHLHRPQLLRPRRRDRLADPEGADHLQQADQRPGRLQRPGRAAQGLGQDRLGGRARRRHRHQGALRREGRRAEVRRRLLRRQRRLRARVPARARRHLGQGQGLRHLRPGRPVDGHQRRDRRSAGAADVARGQRQADAERQHQRP